jgi:BirA family biotin operon repressor/biotin-[acetyl-CoA-carboxylase] ligase
MLERFRLTSGALLLAETQTAGRGRAGRSWVSPPDVNLYFTIVLHLESLLAARPLAYVAPLAVALALEEVSQAKDGSVDIDLKWPNDVLLNGRKAAGVLIETTAAAEGQPVALVGIGINVNLDVEAHPEIREIATSLSNALGFSVSREEVLAACCNHFESLYEEAKSGGRRPFEAWRSRLITLGKTVVASGAGRPIEGIAKDVDDDGALLIAEPDGRLTRVVAGDVTLAAR